MLTEHEIAARVTRNAEVLGGKPIIRGTRVPIDLIVGLVDNGVSAREILEDYPDLSVEDIDAAIAYALQNPDRAEAARS